MIDQPVFEIGTEIIAELAPDGKELRFRYDKDAAGNDFLIDHGPSGDMVYGEVQSINIDIMVATFSVFLDGEQFYYGIPLFGHPAYREDQFYMSGYPMPVYFQNRKIPVCTCGSRKVYGIRGPHSHWCDMNVNNDTRVF